MRTATPGLLTRAYYSIEGNDQACVPLDRPWLWQLLQQQKGLRPLLTFLQSAGQRTIGHQGGLGTQTPLHSFEKP